ncbi:MAG: T9SS type A sorting domain-containing protein [Bacteroidales bacterium]|jgi:hypothetical protein|nr:T9SS type A sorting domain-containing protein [Bacteroidales bacterium]
MKKEILKTICITLVAVICMCSLNAQQTRKLDIPTKPVSQIEEVTTKVMLSNRAVIYSEGFENTIIDIDDGVLPTGWIRSYEGEYNWMVVNDQPNYGPESYNIPNVINKVSPFEGSQFMALSWIDCGLGNWAISEGFELTSSVAYEVSFQLVMPGYPGYDETSSIECRIGTTPTAEAMATAHILYNNTERIVEWTFVSSLFTPSETGTYYLFFNDNTPPAPLGWGIYHGIDDIKVFGSDIAPCNSITNLSAAYTEDCKAELSWTASANAHSYKVFRNAEHKATVTDTFFTDEGLDTLSGYTWRVIAVCPDMDAIEVAISLPACKQPHESVKDVTKIAFTIVPNPAKDKIEIKSEKEFNKVEIVNFLGQIVLSNTNDTETTTIDVSNFNSGVYFVRIISNTGTFIQKFVKQ